MSVSTRRFHGSCQILKPLHISTAQLHCRQEDASTVNVSSVMWYFITYAHVGSYGCYILDFGKLVHIRLDLTVNSASFEEVCKVAVTCCQLVPMVQTMHPKTLYPDALTPSPDAFVAEVTHQMC